MTESDNYNLYFEMSKRWSMDVKMPFKDPSGNDVVLPMVIMSAREQYEAKKDAERDTKLSYGKDVPKKDEVSEWDNRFNDHFAYWTIYYSVRQPGDLNKRLFPNKESVMQALTVDQAAILSNDYMTLQINQPWLTNLDNDDPAKMEGLLEELIKAGKNSAFFLNSLTSHSQNILISFLVAKLAKLQTDNGSSIMPPEEAPIS